jgi:phenylacetate-CoA ligase
VTSEKLYDEQRTLISEVFACPVANGYGARDAGFIAHECPSGSLHISAEDIVVETVRSDGKPTALGEARRDRRHAHGDSGFPFCPLPHRRYRSPERQTCACGRGLPVLEEVQGRTTDFVVAQ